MLKVQRWNLDVEVRPAAVTYPETPEQIALVLQCARDFDVKVQPKGGGHSFGNYGEICIYPGKLRLLTDSGSGLGGNDGAVVVDLKHFQQFSMNKETWYAQIGAGTRLKDVTTKLHDAGGRAIAHGTCPAVGIGGHATIGGLGPTSRQFGTALDHVEAVKVVLANGTITQASWTENSDLFFALKGAGAGFAIITEFTVHTEPEPSGIVHYSFSFSSRPYAPMSSTFKKWQKMISDPALPRELASQIIIGSMGMVVTGTWYGTKASFESLAIQHELFDGHINDTIVINDWLGHVAHLADEATLLLGTGQPTPIYCKSLAFKNTTLIPDDVIDTLFEYFDTSSKGTPLWFAYFDLEGGATNDIPLAATAYAHRDVLFYMQSYAIGLDWGHVAPVTKNFIRGIADTISNGMKGVDFGVYAGYVDPELENAQEKYWGGNLKRLEEIKGKWDSGDLLSNPQSVRPVRVEGGGGHDEL